MAIDIKELRTLVRRHEQVALSIPLKPKIVSELLDRLEATESDALEQARLNGMASERQATLKAWLEATEKERGELLGDRATLQQMVYSLKDRVEVVEKERDKLKALNSALCTHSNAQVIHNARQAEENYALRAKITEMERQEPVRHEFQGRDGTWHPFIDQRHYENTVADGSWPIRALYLVPGAQPAPRINPASLYAVINWLRNGCDPSKAADELEMFAAKLED